VSDTLLTDTSQTSQKLTDQNEHQRLCEGKTNNRLDAVAYRIRVLYLSCGLYLAAC
jgi:hypothetical protein